jgi:hypothetical protein
MLMRRPCTPQRGPRPLGKLGPGRDRGAALRFTTRVSEYTLFLVLHRWGFKGSKMPLTKAESDQDLDLGMAISRVFLSCALRTFFQAPTHPPLSFSLSLYLSLSSTHLLRFM